MKVITKTNWHVEVYPSGPGVYPGVHIGGLEQSDKEWERDCEEIKEQISRHVDGIQDSRNKARVCTAFDKEVTCSFCKREWEEDENGKPVCCDEAIEEWEKNH